MPRPAGGQSGPRHRAGRGATGWPTLAIPGVLDRRPQMPWATDRPEAEPPSHGPRVEEDTAEVHDPAAVEVLPTLYGHGPDQQARFARDVQTHVQFLVRG